MAINLRVKCAEIEIKTEEAKINSTKHKVFPVKNIQFIPLTRTTNMEISRMNRNIKM